MSDSSIAEHADLGDFKTLEQFILEQQHQFDHSSGSFSRLLRDMSVAAKIVNRDMRRAGLLDIFGQTGITNVQGEVQKKMDALAHKEFVLALRRGGECCLIGSEEHAEAIPIDASSESDGHYIVLMDPLDGSSNIDVNVSVGTIFSIYRTPDDIPPEEATLDDVLQPGTEQVAAGYIVYGSSTMLVYTTGDGVNGFTLDPSIGEFLLSHRSLQTPDRGRICSINSGNYHAFDQGLRDYLNWVQEYDESDPNRPAKTRYIGSFVSDFHRNMLMGGIYMYPATQSNPSGKLRLMYEANPMAFLIEQAGGKATNGTDRIMELKPESLHERTPLFIGSPEMVDRAHAFMQGNAPQQQSVQRA